MRFRISVVALLYLCVAADAAEVQDAATAIRVVKSVCKHEDWPWFAERRGDTWDVFTSRTGVNSRCVALRAYVRVKDGALVGSANPSNPCIECTP